MDEIQIGELLSLSELNRERVWQKSIQAIEHYIKNIRSNSASAMVDPTIIREYLQPFDFEQPVDPTETIDIVTKGLLKHQSHFTHPLYMGLYNPRPSTMGIVADLLASAFNCQLAAYPACPFGIEVEQHLIKHFGARFGFDPKEASGTFTVGGTEANHTALLLALSHRFPDFFEKGSRSFFGQPRIYVSAESHHSIHRSARLSGLGSSVVCDVPTDSNLRMDLGLLEQCLDRDLKGAQVPFMIVATVGSSSAGAIDSVANIARIAKNHGLWLHLDGAYGGAGVLLPEFKALFECSELADSITLDPHKWLSIPMGCGLLLTRHKKLLRKTFEVDFKATALADRTGDVNTPYQNSLQWSRRFIGLKLFMTLLTSGWKGYEEVLRHQVKMGDLLRAQLKSSGWKILNQTPFPVVCFSDDRHRDGSSSTYLWKILNTTNRSGKSWIAPTFIRKDVPALRACITNFSTHSTDITDFVEQLNQARES